MPRKLLIKMMLHPEEERLTAPPVGHVVPFSGTLMPPPFAPHPHYADNDGATCRTTASTSTGRSGTVVTHTSQPQTKKSGCGFHEICHHLQQVVFISAIVTGLALVVAGFVLRSSDMVVFIYIGVLLVGVNSALLAIQCFVYRKQKRRARTYTTSRLGQNPNPIMGSTGTQQTQYTPISTKAPPTSAIQSTAAVGNQDACIYSGQPFCDYSAQSSQRSPTDSHIKYFSSVHSTVSYRQGGSIGSQQHHYHHYHHHGKDKFHLSPPLGPHQASHHRLVPSQPPNRSELEVFPSLPPPSYNDLIVSGRSPRDGTTLHLI